MKWPGGMPAPVPTLYIRFSKPSPRMQLGSPWNVQEFSSSEWFFTQKHLETLSPSLQFMVCECAIFAIRWSSIISCFYFQMGKLRQRGGWATLSHPVLQDIPWNKPLPTCCSPALLQRSRSQECVCYMRIHCINKSLCGKNQRHVRLREWLYA